MKTIIKTPTYKIKSNPHWSDADLGIEASGVRYTALILADVDGEIRVIEKRPATPEEIEQYERRATPVSKRLESRR